MEGKREEREVRWMLKMKEEERERELDQERERVGSEGMFGI